MLWAQKQSKGDRNIYNSVTTGRATGPAGRLAGWLQQS